MNGFHGPKSSGLLYMRLVEMQAKVRTRSPVTTSSGARFGTMASRVVYKDRLVIQRLVDWAESRALWA